MNKPCARILIRATILSGYRCIVQRWLTVTLMLEQGIFRIPAHCRPRRLVAVVGLFFLFFLESARVCEVFGDDGSWAHV